jgi:hypothetical protein
MHDRVADHSEVWLSGAHLNVLNELQPLLAKANASVCTPPAANAFCERLAE